MRKPFQWALAFAAVAAALAVVAGLVVQVLEERRQEQEARRPAARPRRVSRAPNGDIIVTVGPETVRLSGIRTEPLAEAAFPREAVAYGRFQEDPARTFALRAPVGGVLRRAAGTDWPALGEKLGDGVTVGLLQPRFAPAERVDLAVRLEAARAEVSATKASLAAAQASLRRARTLNAEDKNVSDRTLQEAEAKAKGEEARLAAAEATLKLLESAVASGEGVSDAFPLILARGGEVVEVSVQPGEAVETGATLLRVSRFDELLARVALPAGERLEGPVSEARIVVLGREELPLRGTRIGAGGAADPRLLGETYLFRVKAGDSGLRPGMALTASLALPGAPERGVLLPRAAVVRFGGKMWAYLEAAPDRFFRREIAEARLLEKGWFVTRGFSSQDRVVVSGAQTLLSEELSSQIRLEEERD